MLHYTGTEVSNPNLWGMVRTHQLIGEEILLQHQNRSISVGKTKRME